MRKDSNRFSIWLMHLVGRSARWQEPTRVVLRQTTRLTLAAVLAYLAALGVFPGTQPLTGPLTALLVVQATLFSTLTMGFQRVLSVVSGVLLAVLFSALVGLTWWSLGLVVAASLLVGQMLRLGPQLLEAPISAMLILGVGAASSAATQRVAETLIGAGVGVLVNVVFPPELRAQSAGEAVRQVADEAADLLAAVARELPDDPSRDRAYGWLREVRDLSRFVRRADRAITDATASRKLNPRAMREVDNEPILRGGLDALEHSTVALRALFRSIADGVREAEADEHDEYTPELLGAFAVLLDDLAKGLRAYGALVYADADTRTITTDPALAEALDALRETRAVLTELLLTDAGDNPDQWMLRGSLLASVDRVLTELDLEERARQRERWEGYFSTRRKAMPVLRKLRQPPASRA